jgi:4-hydroxybenzoyl-CoA reductase subunit beta
MMRLPPFRYLAPRSVVDAASMLADAGPEAALLAGGTDLLPGMKRRQFSPRVLIGLRGIPDLRGERGDPRSGIAVGAMTSISAIERSEWLRAAWPALPEAARLIATPPIRNLGTLGGNLCLDARCNYWNQGHEWREAIGFCLKKDGAVCWVAPGSDRCWAVSSSDTAPVLCALGAEVTLSSFSGGRLRERRIAVTDLFRDDGARPLAKEPEEILTAAHLPPASGWRAAYRKLRRRGSFDFPVLGVAIAAHLSATGTVEEARIVLGGIGSRPQLAPEAARGLVGRRLADEDAIREAADLAAHRVRPLDNTDFDMTWRKQVAPSYVATVLRELGQ